MTGIRIADSAWPAVEKSLKSGAHAILPIGATCKQHGRHLPCNTDFRQVDWLVEQLIGRLNIVAWPELGYGFYPAFTDYPGSVSLSEETYLLVVGEILDSIESSGAQKISVLNTGISTIRPLQTVLRTRTNRSKVHLVNVYEGPAFTRAAKTLEQQDWGGHADEIETSIMLAVDQHTVDLSKASSASRRIRNGRFNRRRPDEPNYSPDGVNGNPCLATRDKGERFLTAMLEDVISQITSQN